MIQFFNDKRLSDITVTCAGQKIWAHKVILAARSSYFHKVFGSSPTVGCPIL